MWQSTKIMATDILGKALLDYQNGNYTEDIKTFSSFDEEDVIPLPYLFRDFGSMPSLEQKALELCQGSVLDIGCGAGSHSLYLQKQRIKVTALDSSSGAIETCKARGVHQTRLSEIEKYTGENFDTLLLLMNGIGLAGTLPKLGRFLNHLKSLLKPNGQILLDSSNLIYMFEKDEDGSHFIPASDTYYGEVTFAMTYKNEHSAPFHWLYIDFNKLYTIANQQNLSCELICDGKHYDYLARLKVLQQ